MSATYRRAMPAPNTLPSGSWPTPITSELVVRAAARLGEVRVDGTDVWWSEGRPAEGGRSVVVRRSADGTTTDVLPAPWNARTRVHEYGGGSWTVSAGTLWFTHFADQRLYRLDPGSDTPVAVTPEPALPGSVRHADLQVTPDGVLAVRETHAEGDRAADVVNEIVRIRPDGGTDVLVSGPDFVSDPRQEPDGPAVAFLRWNHPDMPWDAAQLVVRDGEGGEHVIAGGPGESVVQPVWGEDAALWWLSDRTDTWSLYRRRPHGEAELVLDVGSDIAGPQWVFGQSRYAVLPDGRVAVAYGRDGRDRLAVLEPGGEPREFDLPYGVFRYVTAADGGIVCVAAGPSSEPVVLRVPLDDGDAEVLRPARDLGLDPAWFSAPEHVTFPTEDRGTGIAEAHALVYPPTNPEVTAPEGDLPPLIVHVHGGPTAAASPALDLQVQYWTSRGFCVADVDYRGSTGYGRRYREALKGRWASSTSTTSWRAHAPSPAPAGSTRPAWPSPVDRPAATRPWPRCRCARGSSPPVPATTAWPTSAPWPPRRTSSSPATSTAWWRPGPRAGPSTTSGPRSTTSTPWTPRWRSSRAPRTRWSPRTRPR